MTLAVSYRSDELHRRHPLRPLLADLVRLPTVERLALAGFTRAELAEHLEAIAGAPLAATQVEGIHARSEGNPFYAEQLLTAGAGDPRVELRATLAEVLLARVQELSEPARQVLRVAAVAGRRVPRRLLAAVAGRPEAELEQGLREAVGAQVLTPTPPPGATRSATPCSRRRSTATCWQAAAEGFAYGNVYAVARCRWRLAEALATAGDRERAAEAARAAHATATRLRAALLRAALEALARRGRLDLGVDLPTRPTLARRLGLEQPAGREG